jgi:hypothetical protein
MHHDDVIVDQYILAVGAIKTKQRRHIDMMMAGAAGVRRAARVIPDQGLCRVHPSDPDSSFGEHPDRHTGAGRARWRGCESR